MLKIVYPICCGIDVHKTFVVATIAATDQKNITLYQTKRFSTFTRDLNLLALWLSDNCCFDICMESTGKYWIPVFNVLEKTCRVTLAHPKYVKAIRGKKTDKKDSVWIADLFKHDLVPASFIPPEPIRQLRDLTRYRTKLISYRTGEKNRIQNSLTVSNIMLSSVVSDTFGKSSSAIIKHLLDDPSDKDFDFLPLLHGSMLKKQDDIRLAIDGEISVQQAQKLSICYHHLKNINTSLSDLEDAIIALAQPYSYQIALLASMPGIKPFSAIAIISEIGSDMLVFKSSKHLCSWAGLTPQNNESAGKKKSVRVSRAGVYIKPLLVQCANAAIKSKDFPHFRLRYESIKRRRGHKRAIIAIARMMLTIIYRMLSDNTPFKPELLKNSKVNPEHSKFSVDRAIARLKSLGYSVILNSQVPDSLIAT